MRTFAFTHLAIYETTPLGLGYARAWCCVSLMVMEYKLGSIIVLTLVHVSLLPQRTQKLRSLPLTVQSLKFFSLNPGVGPNNLEQCLLCLNGRKFLPSNFYLPGPFDSTFRSRVRRSTTEPYPLPIWSLIFCCFVNLFTARACKISGPKSACKQNIFLVLYFYWSYNKSTLITVHFDFFFKSFEVLINAKEKTGFQGFQISDYLDWDWVTVQ